MEAYNVQETTNRLNILDHIMKRGAQIFLGVFFIVAGILHFLLGEVFATIVPPLLPFPLQIVWLTGVMELVFAAGLLLKRQMALVGILLSLYLLAVLPANIYMALGDIPLGDGRQLAPVILWGRVALQFPLIGLVLWCCGAWPFARKA